MIKFFRKIRQNLLSEGKTGRYLKYAIGEIILVVIGILIALQINNWNSTKKADHQELELYAIILNDLNDSFRSTIGKKTRMKRTQNLHYQVYNESIGSAVFDPTTNYHHLQHIIPYDAVMTEKHTESLSIIRNDSIRDLLKQLIKNEKIVSEAYTTWNELKKERLWPFLSKFGIHNTESTFNDQPYHFGPLFYLDIIDHSKLKEQYGSTELDEILFDLRYWTSWTYSSLNNLERSNNRFEKALVRALTERGRTESIKRIPRKHLSDLLTEGRSIDKVIQVIRSGKEQESDYVTSQFAINALAYDLLREDRLDEALKLFKLNTELYPESVNTWDSLSTCLIAMGKKEEGIEAFKKFIELWPENQFAKRKLEQLKQLE